MGSCTSVLVVTSKCEIENTVDTERNNLVGKWGRRSLYLVLGIGVLRLLIARQLELAPDEAYYWVWSERLAEGYYDHPPGVAYLIRFGTSILGANVLGVRLGSILASGLTAWILFKLGSEMFRNSLAGFAAVLILTLVPLFSVGALIMTPDTPQALAWAASLFFFWRTVGTGKRHWWLLTGLAAGLGLLSKYVAVLFGLCVIVWMLVDRDSRRWLLTPWPYLCASVTTIVFLPVILWNAKNEWVSFLFQLGHGFSDREGGVATLAEFVGGQIVLATPILFGLAVYCWIQATKRVVGDDRELLFHVPGPGRYQAFWDIHLEFPGGGSRTSGEIRGVEIDVPETMAEIRLELEPDEKRYAVALGQVLD